MSVRTPQAIPSPDEDRLEFDDIPFDPTGHRNDLPDPTAAVVLGVEMHHDVYAAGHRRHHEPAPDVLACQSSKGRVQALTLGPPRVCHLRPAGPPHIAASPQPKMSG